jgi:hypothetical protein
MGFNNGGQADAHRAPQAHAAPGAGIDRRQHRRQQGYATDRIADYADRRARSMASVRRLSHRSTSRRPTPPACARLQGAGALEELLARALDGRARGARPARCSSRSPRISNPPISTTSLPASSIDKARCADRLEHHHHPPAAALCATAEEAGGLSGAPLRMISHLQRLQRLPRRDWARQDAADRRRRHRHRGTRLRAHSRRVRASSSSIQRARSTKGPISPRRISAGLALLLTARWLCQCCAGGRQSRGCD